MPSRMISKILLKKMGQFGGSCSLKLEQKEAHDSNKVTTHEKVPHCNGCETSKIRLSYMMKVPADWVCVLLVRSLRLGIPRKAAGRDQGDDGSLVS